MGIEFFIIFWGDLRERFSNGFSFHLRSLFIFPQLNFHNFGVSSIVRNAGISSHTFLSRIFDNLWSRLQGFSSSLDLDIKTPCICTLFKTLLLPSRTCTLQIQDESFLHKEIVTKNSQFSTFFSILGFCVCALSFLSIQYKSSELLSQLNKRIEIRCSFH